MVNLILVVMAIALSAALLAVVSQYIPMDAVQRQQKTANLTADVATYQQGIERFLVAQRVRIEPTLAGELSPGYFIPWPHLTGTTLTNLVSPEYVYEPKGLDSTRWRITAGTYAGLNAVALCLEPKLDTTLSDEDKAVLRRVHAKQAPGQAFLGSACNTTTQVDGGNHLTIWFPISHYE